MGDKPNAHLGSSVIMVRYESPELSGQPRAAMIVDGPFILQEGPNVGQWGADLVWWVNERGVDPENEDPTLSDWRKNVLYDPTGQTPRSWHVWGEAAGEE